MATNEVKRAQVPTVCNLCETETNVRYKCLDCDKLMCDRCKIIHTKVTDIHEIYDLKSLDHHKISTTYRLDNIVCEIHKKKYTCMFCKDCEFLVCPECIVSSHQHHDMETLDRFCDQKLSKLEKIESEVKGYLLNIQDSYEYLCKLKLQNEKDFSKVRNEVDEKEKKLIDCVIKYAGQLRDEIEEKERNANVTILKRETELERVERSLNEILDTIKNLKESKRGELILAAPQNIMKKYPKVGHSYKYISNENLQFYAASEYRDLVELFGSLKTSSNSCKFEFQIINSYSTILRNIENILVSDNDTGWISTFKKNYTCLQKFKVRKTIETVREFEFHVFDMALTNSNKLVLSLQSTSTVDFMSTDGEIRPFIDVSPFIVKAIYCTEDDIILSIREDGAPFDIDENSCRKIIVYGFDKKEKGSYEYDKDNQRLFTGPSKINTNINDDIIVSDWTSYTQGRVVTITRNGDLKWIYKGCPKINSENNYFRPYGLVTTSDGNIIVADKNNHALHILSESGCLLSAALVDEVGITLPRSLFIDTWGHLWIGCSTRKEETNNAKIHVVKFSFRQ